MKELIEQIAKALVDNPDEVSVHPIEGEQPTVFELHVAQSDVGKVRGIAFELATSDSTDRRRALAKLSLSDGRTK